MQRTGVKHAGVSPGLSSNRMYGFVDVVTGSYKSEFIENELDEVVPVSVSDSEFISCMTSSSLTTSDIDGLAFVSSRQH